MPVSIDEFMSYIKVKENILYDTSRLKHALPNIQGSHTLAWKYFGRILPEMVSVPSADEEYDTDIDEEDEEDTGYSIFVPDEATKQALYLHMSATPKIKWPTVFPSYVQYSWDISAGRDESVFLKETDLIQYMIMIRAPSETVSFVVSPSPYILSRGDNKYLIQMASNMEHAKYIAYKWENEVINSGYEGVIVTVDYPLKDVSSDFTDRLYEISYTIKDTRIFVIIPI